MANHEAMLIYLAIATRAEPEPMRFNHKPYFFKSASLSLIKIASAVAHRGTDPSWLPSASFPSLPSTLINAQINWIQVPRRPLLQNLIDTLSTPGRSLHRVSQDTMFQMVREPCGV